MICMRTMTIESRQLVGYARHDDYVASAISKAWFVFHAEIWSNIHIGDKSLNPVAVNQNICLTNTTIYTQSISGNRVGLVFQFAVDETGESWWWTCPIVFSTKKPVSGLTTRLGVRNPRRSDGIQVTGNSNLIFLVLSDFTCICQVSGTAARSSGSS